MIPAYVLLIYYQYYSDSRSRVIRTVGETHGVKYLSTVQDCTDPNVTAW